MTSVHPDDRWADGDPAPTSEDSAVLYDCYRYLLRLGDRRAARLAREAAAKALDRGGAE